MNASPIATPPPGSSRGLSASLAAISIPWSQRQASWPALVAAGLSIALIVASGCGDPPARSGRVGAQVSGRSADQPLPVPVLPPPGQTAPIPESPGNGPESASSGIPIIRAAPAADAVPALKPLPGSSGADIVAGPHPVPTAPRSGSTPATPQPARTAVGAGALSGTADPAAPPTQSTPEPGTDHGLIIPGPADQPRQTAVDAGGASSTSAPRPADTPAANAPALGSPVRPAAGPDGAGH